MLTVGLGLLGDQPPGALVRIAAAAEAGGVEAIWVPDERFFRDPYVVLTAVASATRRVRLGPCVTDPFVRHPAITAVAIGTLQEVSGGRAVLGLGAGISGFAPLGIRPERTAQVLREAVALIRDLLAGERAEVRGVRVAFRGRLDFSAAPVPVYIAGRGPRILELAGEIGDGVIIGALAAPEGLRYAQARVAAGAARAGRTPGSLARMMWLHTYVHEDGERAHRAARRIVLSVLQSSRAILADLGVALAPALAAVVDRAPYGSHRQAGEDVHALIPPDLVAAFTAAGTPEAVAARLQDLHRRGIDHIALRLWPVDGQRPEDAVQLLVDQVLPRLRGGGP